MQYRKIISGETVIEFHNSWLGEETVIVNGQLVSKKSSIVGTNHFFNVMENGSHVRYVLRSRISDQMTVVIDLKRNGMVIHDNIHVPIRFGSGKTINKPKKNGLNKLKEYDLEAALEDFQKAIDIDPHDPEIYFHMACAYSIQEKTVEGFESLQKAIELNLPEKEMILKHEMLAYLRMQPDFENFLESGFKHFDKESLQKKS